MMQLTFLQIALLIAASMLAVALILAFVRLLIGPDMPDRVVALDLVAILVVAVVATYIIATDQPHLFDAAITLALVAFLGTVAFARFIERSGHDD